VRIVLAVHAFLPASTAGVEVYTSRLAHALRRLGHEVLVLTAVHDLGSSTGDVRHRDHEGIPVVEVVSLHQAGTLEATYDDPILSGPITRILQDYAPHVVHVQHLLNLSAAVVTAGRAQGAAVLLTLHDHWLSCPRDGLRMREDLSLCVEVEHATCSACLARSPYLVPLLQRRAAGAARAVGAGRLLHRVHRIAPRATTLALRLARRATRPVDLVPGLDRRRARLLALMDDVDLILAPTRFVAERAVAWGAPRARVRVVPLGAVPASLRRVESRGVCCRFGFMGTLAPHKGAHVLVDAFRGLDGPDLRLTLHGALRVDPGYVSRLREASRGDPRIQFAGAFAEGCQAAILDGLDALVVPSVWWENSPLTVLEAVSAGVPVVASDIGGIPEVLPPGAGLLVPAGDVHALRAALQALVAGKVTFGGLAPASPTPDEGARELAALYAAAVDARAVRVVGTG
jgi:glycosyltransferase involved in cell wall biosynthesis